MYIRTSVFVSFETNETITTRIQSTLVCWPIIQQPKLNWASLNGTHPTGMHSCFYLKTVLLIVRCFPHICFVPLHTSNTCGMMAADLRWLFVESRVVFSLTCRPRCLTKIADFISINRISEWEE